MSLANFLPYSLTKPEMRGIRGGTIFCGCTKNKNGATLTISYATESEYCANPSAGNASYSYSYKNKSTSGYMSNADAASLCGYVQKKPKQYT